MSTYNDQRKASLADYAVSHYQRFLAALNHNNGRGCSFPDRLICLNYYFRQITYRQYHLLFPLKDEGCLRVTLNRLEKKGYLEQLRNIPDCTAYSITTSGAAYISKKLPSLFATFYPLPEEKDYHFTVDEVLSFLDGRLNGSTPSYWYHFFGIRDFYFTFLSNPLTCSDFLFLQECPVDNGRPLSVYQQTLNTYIKRTLGKDSLRADGLLMSKCPAYPKLDIPLYLEFDSGSQRSSILVSKVHNYVRNSLPFFRDYRQNPGMKVHMPPSVVFCVSSKYATKKKPEPSRKLSRRKYRGCLTRVAEIFEVISALNEPPRLISGSDTSLNAAIDFLASINDRLLTASTQELLFVLKRYQKDYPGDATKSISSILRLLDNEKAGLSRNYEQNIRDYYLDYYEKRRNLLWNGVLASNMEDLPSAFLSGLSVFTVSYELLPEFLPYLIPELYWYSSSLTTYLSDYGCYKENLSVSYEHIGNLSPAYLFRNHYIAEDTDGVYHFYIENISDDLGGYFRMKYLLDLSGGGCNVTNAKIMCIVTEAFLSVHQNEILKSSFYRTNCFTFRPTFDKQEFELLFCTPDDFDAGRFFMILPDGKRIYKTR